MLNFYVVSAVGDMVNAMTLTGLPCAGAKPELHHYKEKYKKWRSFRKHGFHLITVWLFSDQKLKTFTFGIREQNKGTEKLQRQQLKMDLVTRKK